LLGDSLVDKVFKIRDGLDIDPGDRAGLENLDDLAVELIEF
jgi:hypothetical protein